MIAQDQPTSHRKEIDLLLACTRVSQTTETTERVQALLQQEIDWTYLMRVADEHQVLPLLFYGLKSICPEAIPQDISSAIRQRYHLNNIHNLSLAQELKKLLKLLGDNEILAIPFKGVVLAAAVYGNLALRQIGDIDILVRSQDVSKTKDLLIAQGYQVVSGGWQQCFVHPVKRIAVDLHWQLTPLSHFPFALPDFDFLWQRSGSLEIEGELVANFCPDDLFLYLTVQIARNCYEGKESLAQVCDLAQLMQTWQTASWENILQQVSELRLDRPFFLGLLVAQDILGCPIPKLVKQAMTQQLTDDPVISICAARVQKRFFLTDNVFLVRLFFRRLMVKGPRSQLPAEFYLIWQICVFPIGFLMWDINQADREFCPLPASLEFLYHLIRPFRLISTYGLKKNPDWTTD